jgi:hypothetical protein
MITQALNPCLTEPVRNLLFLTKKRIIPDIMSTIGDINDQITGYFAPFFLEGLKYGENQVNLWFPGSGKTVIINDMISNKQMLQKHLGKFTKRLEIISYSCSGALNPTAEMILYEIATKLKIKLDTNHDQLVLKIIDRCKDIVTKQDKSIVFVGSKFEDIETQEFKKLLTSMARIVSENRRSFFLF